MPRTARNILQDVTSRDFRGGLDVADSELNLTSKYARVLDNIVVGIDGSLEVRQGTALFCDIRSKSTFPIRNVYFYFQFIIIVNTRGEIFSADISGNVNVIWNSTIALTRRAGLTIWSNAAFVAFVEFNGELIVMNGVDKPLHINTALLVDYLADLGSGSNINVPIGSVAATFANHMCIANGSILNVSERNAGGTWTNDVGVQFANIFDLKPYVPSGDSEILGLYPFKNFLLISFREYIIPIIFVEDATATPKLNMTVQASSVLKNYGAISPRVGQDIGEQELVADIVGVAALALNYYTLILSPDRPSRYIDPLLQPAINKLDSLTLRNSAFSIYDRKLSAYTLYLPDTVELSQQMVTGYLYRYIEKLNIKAWSILRGWNWGAATRSTSGNVFYSRHADTKVFIQGDSKTNPLFADFIGEQETWSDGTTWQDNTGFGPVSDVATSGVPIDSVWEIPWTDLKHRALSKTLRYIVMDTEGSETFTAKIFVDDYYQGGQAGETWSDSTTFTDGTGWTPFAVPPLTPALTMDYVARDAGGYGFAPFGDAPYGGGNNTGLRTLTLLPTKFTTAKVRFEARTKGPLKYVSLSLLYQQGTIRRLP